MSSLLQVGGDISGVLVNSLTSQWLQGSESALGEDEVRATEDCVSECTSSSSAAVASHHDGSEWLNRVVPNTF